MQSPDLLISGLGPSPGINRHSQRNINTSQRNISKSQRNIVKSQRNIENDTNMPKQNNCSTQQKCFLHAVHKDILKNKTNFQKNRTMSPKKNRQNRFLNQTKNYEDSNIVKVSKK